MANSGVLLMRGRIAYLSASLATLSQRSGHACHIAKDLSTGRYAVWRGECPLASGDTPELAVKAALELHPEVTP